MRWWLTSRGRQDELLRKAVLANKAKNWKKIAELMPDRTDVQCLHRWQKVLNPELVKGPWTKEVRHSLTLSQKSKTKSARACAIRALADDGGDGAGGRQGDRARYQVRPQALVRDCATSQGSHRQAVP